MRFAYRVGPPLQTAPDRGREPWTRPSRSHGIELQQSGPLHLDSHIAQMLGATCTTTFAHSRRYRPLDKPKFEDVAQAAPSALESCPNRSTIHGRRRMRSRTRGRRPTTSHRDYVLGARNRLGHAAPLSTASDSRPRGATGRPRPQARAGEDHPLPRSMGQRSVRPALRPLAAPNVPRSREQMAVPGTRRQVCAARCYIAHRCYVAHRSAARRAGRRVCR